MKLHCGFCGNDFPEGVMRFNHDGEWLCGTCVKDANRQRDLANAVRLTADAVIAAADAYVRKDMDEMWLEEHKCWLNDGQLALARAVLAHRKAKEEASRG